MFKLSTSLYKKFLWWEYGYGIISTVELPFELDDGSKYETCVFFLEKGKRTLDSTVVGRYKNESAAVYGHYISATHFGAKEIEINST